MWTSDARGAYPKLTMPLSVLLRAIRGAVLSAVMVACGGGDTSVSPGPSPGPGPGGATRLVVHRQPPTTTSGLTMPTQPVVYVTDASGRLVTTASNVVITARLESGTGRLQGTSTITSISGVATFVDLRVDGAGAHQLAFEAASLAPVVSDAFSVEQIPASLTVEVQPTGRFSSRPLTTQPQVSVRDIAGLLIQNLNATVTVVRALGNGVLEGTTTATTVNGRAAFTDLRLTGNGFHTLQFSMPSVPPRESEMINIEPLAPLVATDISLGVAHTCATVTSGQVYCWGDNAYGQLGDSTFSRSFEPRLIGGDMRFTALSSGYDHNCALATTGYVWCWGSATERQLGIASAVDVPYPIVLPGGVPFVELVARGFHSCARTSLGLAYCWGSNDQGTLGVGDRNPRTGAAPVAGGLTFVKLSASAAGTCGLTPASAIFCWGGEPPDSDTTGRIQNVPTEISNGITFTAVEYGVVHGCGWSIAREWYCWGSNRDLQFGSDSARVYAQPTRLDPLAPYVSMSIGFAHQCVLTVTGAAYCWGLNADGQLGDGTTITRATPTLVLGGHAFKRIVAGTHHTCGFLASGEVLCWGRNSDGQVGDGTTTMRNIPTAVISP